MISVAPYNLDCVVAGRAIIGNHLVWAVLIGNETSCEFIEYGNYDESRSTQTHGSFSK